MSPIQKIFGKNFSIWKLRALMFFSVVGPGIITGTADNDAGGITTYSVVGAHFGYKMLWILLFITLLLYVTQEMGARLGIVTGQGLGDLIRERLGIKLAFYLICLVFLVNFSNVLADVAGVASVADIYHIPRLFFVPVFTFLLWYLILKGNFNIIQNVFLTSCVLFFAYIINGFISKPDIPAMLHGSFVPSIEMSREYIFTATALIGTTLTVWGQFFVQSYFVDKGVTKKHIKSARLDVFFGALWTDVGSYFMIISAAATLFVNHIRIKDAVDAAIALEPLLGTFAKHLFAWGLLNASLLGVGVISLATAYAISEVLGAERKVNASFKDAPLFYSIVGFCIFVSTFLVFIPQLPMVFILTATQALNTMILPIIFFVILQMINDKKLMGEHANNLSQNILSWVAIISFSAISLVMLYLTIT
jgi:Mn2+/Fe2+ NRAMP family transporter